MQSKARGDLFAADTLVRVISTFNDSIKPEHVPALREVGAIHPNVAAEISALEKTGRFPE